LFSSNLHTRQTITQLANAFTEELQALILHCSQSKGGYTLSDFDLIFPTSTQS
jgi:hypothetical protein